MRNTKKYFGDLQKEEISKHEKERVVLEEEKYFNTSKERTI